MVNHLYMKILLNLIFDKISGLKSKQNIDYQLLTRSKSNKRLTKHIIFLQLNLSQGGIHV